MPMYPNNNPREGKFSLDPRELSRRDALKLGAGAVILGGLTAAGLGVRKLLSHNHDHSAEVQAWWEREQAIFDGIDQAGGLQNYVNNNLRERIEQAFMMMDENGQVVACKCCVDEGIRRVMQGQQAMRMSREAGSGILNLDALGRQDMAGFDPKNPNYLQMVARRHNHERTPTKVETYHDECGAARVAFGIANRLTPEDLENVTDEEINEYARTWTFDLFRERQHQLVREGRRQEADQLRFQAIPFNQMNRPSHLHIPRVIYYGRGDYNYAFDGLPQGYGVDRDALPAHIAKQNMTVSKAINFGKHGPGRLFTAQNPQRIYCVGGGTIDQATLQQECQEAFARDVDFLSGKVVIDGFTPQQQQANGRRQMPQQAQMRHRGQQQRRAA